jgi:hypothetical protein
MRTRWTASLSAAALAIILGSSAAFAQGGKGSVCKDGTKSEASGKGACSGHGGVDSAATAAAAKAARAKGKAAAQVTCTDGTLSKGGQVRAPDMADQEGSGHHKAAAKKAPAPPAKKP